MKLGDKIKIEEFVCKLVDFDNEYFYFKDEWSPAIFKIKIKELEGALNETLPTSREGG